MLKAVKECLKNWLVTHERLYWYIVVGLAVLGFGIVTAMGCAKLEQANAAEEMSVEFEYLYASEAYSSAEQWIAENVQEGQHYVVFAVDLNTGDSITNGVYRIGCIVSNAETVSFSNNGSGRYDLLANYWFNVNGTTIKTSSNSYVQVGTGMTASAIYTLEGDISLVGCFPSATNVMVYEKPISVLYSSDAPYVNFEKLVVVNKIASGDTDTKIYDDIYGKYTQASSMTLSGRFLKTSVDDIEYIMDVDFLVELPSDAYITGLAAEHGIDLSFLTKALKYTPDMVNVWNEYTGNDYNTYKFSLSLPVVLDERGFFEYTFTFPELEYLLMGLDESFRTRFASYNSEDGTYWKAILLSYLHIDTISMSVETTRSDGIVYGPIRSVRFNRGYGTFASALTSVDKNFVTSEALDSMINADLQVAERDHLKELENKVNDLQSQVDGMTSFDTAFGGSLEGSDLWTGFGSLSKGLSSLGPSIKEISSLTGAVFGFIPAPIAGIMSFTLLAICIIAIIKAIRG